LRRLASQGEPNLRDHQPSWCRGQTLTFSRILEFKEIRKEWKARKKEEEAQRKAEEERQRNAVGAQNGGADGQAGTDGAQPVTTYPPSRSVQLPPIGYQAASYPAPPSAGLQQSLPEYGSGHVYSSYTPASPYGQPNQQIYNQRRSEHNPPSSPSDS